MVTLDAIQSKIAKLQKQAESIVEKQTSLGLTKIRDLMARHGLSVADIEQFIGKRRGRKPGKGAKAVKAAGPKRTVAAKYADPKTGATWTGRGRAPVWIRDVKDRSKFLINGSAAKPAAKVARKPRANAAAVKKTVAKRAKAATAKKAAQKTA
ncbi:MULTISPECIES: H-NS histone family protein [unclassified Paraburkholderia]|uniref:H-NS histone family protein n=1 Tax=unclassified Paraburkholderia TaxID=2615204 RepID=UPI002AB724B2|nr:MULTISPECIES: H-NS histone family protein [unclassified Paraburkholderia]